MIMMMIMIAIWGGFGEEMGEEGGGGRSSWGWLIPRRNGVYALRIVLCELRDESVVAF